jgi:hypothetical protein
MIEVDYSQWRFGVTQVKDASIKITRDGIVRYTSPLISELIVQKEQSAGGSDGLLGEASLILVNQFGESLMIEGKLYASTNSVGSVVGVNMGNVDYTKWPGSEPVFIKLFGGTDLGTSKANNISYLVPLTEASAEDSYLLTNITTFVSYLMMNGSTYGEAVSLSYTAFGIAVGTNLLTYDPLGSLMDEVDDGSVYKQVVYLSTLIELLLSSESESTVWSSVCTSYNSVGGLIWSESDGFIEDAVTELGKSNTYYNNINRLFGIIDSMSGTGSGLATKITKANTIKSNVNLDFESEITEESFNAEINGAVIGTLVPPVIVSIVGNKVTLNDESVGLIHEFSYTSSSNENSSLTVSVDGDSNNGSIVIDNGIWDGGSGTFYLNIAEGGIASLTSGYVLPKSYVVSVGVGASSYSFGLVIEQANRVPTSIGTSSGNNIVIEKIYGSDSEILNVYDYFEDEDNNALTWTSGSADLLTIPTSLEGLVTAYGESSEVDGVDVYSSVLMANDGSVDSVESYNLSIKMSAALIVYAPLQATSKTMYKDDVTSSTTIESFLTNKPDSLFSIDSTVFKIDSFGNLTLVESQVGTYSGSETLVVTALSGGETSTMSYVVTIVKNLIQLVAYVDVTEGNNSISFVDVFNYESISGLSFSFEDEKLSVVGDNLVADLSKLSSGVNSIVGTYNYTGLGAKTISISVNYNVPVASSSDDILAKVPVIPIGDGPHVLTSIGDLLTKGSVSERNSNRAKFVKELFKVNNSLGGRKVVMSTSELGVSLTKTKVRLVLASGSLDELDELGDGLETLDLTTGLESDEGVHVYLSIGGKIVLINAETSTEIKRLSETNYNVTTDFGGANAVAVTVQEGYTFTDGNFICVIGSGTGELVESSGGGGDGGGGGGGVPSVPICFPAGTPVMTNKGEVAIEKLNPDIHNIRGKRIVAITETRPAFKYIIRIEKDALGKNIPSRRTEISRDHEVFYKGKNVRSEELVGKSSGVYRIHYHGASLYNVLMEKHDRMLVNNLICETLHPENIMAKICCGKYTSEEKKKIYNKLNKILSNNDIIGCKKLYKSLC